MVDQGPHDDRRASEQASIGDSTLRDLWRGVQPPTSGGDLSETDAATQAAVAWMQAAWTALEIPKAVPVASAPVARHQERFQWRHAFAVAAGFLLVLFGTGWWLRADLAVDPVTGMPIGTGGPTSITASVRVADAVGENRVEFVSGPVRLIIPMGPGSGESEYSQ